MGLSPLPKLTNRATSSCPSSDFLSLLILPIVGRLFPGQRDERGLSPQLQEQDS